MAEISLGTLYDFNKQAMAHMAPMDPIAFNKATDDLINHMYEHSKYWMLLCNERKDYTVFILLSREGSKKELRECLINRGQILSIDKQEDDNYEIWIRDTETKENFAYYMFDYSFGIIEA